MRISLDWLREYAELDGTTADLVAALVDTGTEVDRVERGPEGVVVARVVALTPVPESTSGVLFADIDAGEAQPVRVLTGASNLSVGDLVPWAQPGTLLPGWKEPLGVRAMIGGKYHSPGMLCSAVELALGDEADGILILDSGSPGQHLHEAIKLDSVFTVDVTTNRPDCLCHVGIARELTAALGETLREPDTTVPDAHISAVSLEGRVRVTVDTDLCPRFTVRVIENVAVAPSPDWMQRRLRAIGLRPINNVVDITNYVMHELGQPLHAFDLDRFVAAGGGDSADVRVRPARDGETLHCLDGVERRLERSDLVVAAGDVAVSLAGVMGGDSTAVTGATRTILLEGATWDPATIRATSRRLSLRSDASARFEKGLSDFLTPTGVDRAAALIADLGHGHVLRDVIDVRAAPLPPIPAITLPVARASALLGYEVDATEAATVLARLGFTVTQDASDLHVTPPPFRRDVAIAEDVVEEIGRLLGYDRLPSTLPGRRSTIRALAATVSTEDRVRDLLTGAGFDEAITFSFIPPHLAEVLPGSGGEPAPIPLANPLTEEPRVLRTSIMPGLVEVVGRNVDLGNEGVAVFEVGRVYWEGRRVGLAPGSTPDGVDRDLTPLPAEPLLVAVAMHSDGPDASVRALRHVQASLTAIAGELGGATLDVVPETAPGFHSGRSGRLRVGGDVVGIIGELDSATTQRLDLRGRVTVGELRLDAVVPPRPLQSRYHSVPRVPAVTQDLAVIVPVAVRAGEALTVIRESGGHLLEHVELYDEYRDERLGDGMKSWTFRLVFRAPDRTLTGEEAQQVQDAVEIGLRQRLGARVRR